MSLESFFGLDTNEGGMSPEAFEKFKEQMRKNAAHIAALRKAEKKQKKKEDSLHELLMAFLKGDNKTYLMNVIAALLKRNVPASIVLSCISLVYAPAQKKMDVQFSIDAPESAETSLITPGEFPLHIKVAIDLWFQAIHTACAEYPHRLDKTLKELNEEGDLQLSLSAIQLCTFVMRDHLNEEGIESTAEDVREMVQRALEYILKEIAEKTAGQKALDAGEEA